MDPTDMTLPPDSDALSPSPNSILSPNSSGGGGGSGGGVGGQSTSVRPLPRISMVLSAAASARQSNRSADANAASRPPASTSTSTPSTPRDLAYQRRRERNNEAARLSRLNRKARHEAIRRALAKLQTVAPLARLQRIQTEMEVRGMCAAAGQDYDRVLATAVAQMGVPADYFAAVVGLAGVGGDPASGSAGANVDSQFSNQPLQQLQASLDEKY